MFSRLSILILLILGACSADSSDSKAKDAQLPQTNTCDSAAPTSTTSLPTTTPLPSDADLAEFDAPIVVQTVPAALDMQVDPAISAIEVTFSQDMDPYSLSWLNFGSTVTPTFIGEPEWVDARTVRRAVALEPDHLYVNAFNGFGYYNFVGTNGNQAIPFTQVFRTAPE